VPVLAGRGDSLRTRFYGMLHLPATMDGNLDPDGLAELTSNLRRLAAQCSDLALAQVSANLLESIAASLLPVVQPTPGRRGWWWDGVRSLSRNCLTRRGPRVLLALRLGLPRLF